MSDTEDTAAAMAQAMGFSSFGAQNPSKRRKFNPGTDAVVASSSNPTVPLFRTEHAPGSGSNMTPLGVRTRNKDEINLDLDDDNDEQQPTPKANAMTQGRDGQDGDDDDPEPQYIDTSRPPAPLEPDTGDSIQSQIDNIVGVSAPVEGSAYFASQVDAGGAGDLQGWGRGRGHDYGRNRGRGRGRGGGRGGNQGHGHDSGHNWWEDYYDPWALINPWEKLEKNLGLKPRDSFLTWEEAKAAKALI
ncbi:hypothetical protein F4810DRAFT_437248 [Camillea tinctor]|nr:hypothetical protein F4810DRAFT_437248 [Camillea tinctor]